MSLDTCSHLEHIVKSYGRFVPEQFLPLLGKSSITEISPGDHAELTLTILFSDIRGFTSLSESMTPEQNFTFINSYLGIMEPLLYRNDGIIDKYIGDNIMALFPKEADDGGRA